MAVTPKAASAPPNTEAHSTAETELSMDFSATGAAETSVSSMIATPIDASFSSIAGWLVKRLERRRVPDAQNLHSRL
jgi:hypothetical protein